MNFAQFKDSETLSPWGCEEDSGSLFDAPSWDKSNSFFCVCVWGGGELPRLPTSIKYKKEEVVSQNTFHK